MSTILRYIYIYMILYNIAIILHNIIFKKYLYIICRYPNSVCVTAGYFLTFQSSGICYTYIYRYTLREIEREISHGVIAVW